MSASRESERESMSNELLELYQALILDHNKNPRNFGHLQCCSHKRRGVNPLCGDHLEVFLNVVDHKIKEISFQGEGCAISKASASMMSEFVKGREVDEVLSLFDEFHRLLTRKLDPAMEKHHLGKLEVFSGIWKYPSRVKCASLSWHTLKGALEDKKSGDGEISTEDHE